MYVYNCNLHSIAQWFATVLLNVFLSYLIAQKGFVLETNTWISIFKGIRNEYSRVNLKWAVKQTLWHSLILFFGTPCTFIYDQITPIWVQISSYIIVLFFIFMKYKVFVKHIKNFCHTPFFFSVFLFGPPIVLLLLLCVSNCPEIYCNKSSIPATEYTQILELQDIWGNTFHSHVKYMR